MKRFALVLAFLAVPSVAVAGVEVGGTAGLHVFSNESGHAFANGSDNSLKNSALFGFRLGVYFTSALGVEAEGGFIPTEPRDLVFDVYSLAARGSLVFQLRAGDPKNTIIPFILAGGGILKVVQVNNDATMEAVKEQDIAFHAGIGAKYRAANGWGVRLDFRALLVPDNAGKKTGTQDFEAFVSIYKEFGRKTPKLEKPVEPPPKDDDKDKDGIIGNADACPDKPEDKDGFTDDDGCPDDDNDADGILDGNDKCATDPEDKDGFEDDNGCPDPDNDGDGVLDLADKCPEPETKNGFQDDDGCPDEIPETLKKFTGVIAGITFKVNSADLQAGSNKTLDAAAKVLLEFKDIKLEIGGHTDDQPLKNTKTFADNQALSQARAESVKQYFVKKGVEEGRLTAKGYGDSSPVEDPKGLKGGKLNAARAKNRRVEFKLISDLEEAPPKAEEKPEDKKPEENKPEEKAPDAKKE